MSWQAAAIQAGGQILGGWLGYKGQKEANETNVQTAREQMQFQERMSNTSYQRAVDDMKAAGLNPMLAYSQGGSSSPAGAAQPVGNAMAAGVSAAHQAAQSIAAVQQMQASQAQIAQVRATTDKIKSETLDQDLHSALLAADVNYRQNQGGVSRETGINLQVERALKEIQLAREGDTFSADVARRKAESALVQMDVPRAKAEEKFYQDLGQANPYLKQILMMLRMVSSARGAAR